MIIVTYLFGLYLIMVICMAKKIGQSERYLKLGLLYLERDFPTESVSIRGILRGWASESWSKRCGDPVVYFFNYICDVGKISSREIYLGLIRTDLKQAPLMPNHRKDLRSGIDWHVKQYLSENGKFLDQIPIANNINLFLDLSVKFFTNSNVRTPEFQKNWPKWWAEKKDKFLINIE